MNGRIIAYMSVATILWAIAGSTIAVTPGFSIGTMTLVAGAALLGKALLRRDRSVLFGHVRSNVVPVAVVTVLSAFNAVGYYTALRIGSPPIVTSLHLTGPIIIMAWYVVTRRRVFDWTVLSQIALIAMAIIVLVRGRDDVTDGVETGSTVLVVIGAVLAVMTAFALATTNMVIGHSSLGRSQEFGAGVELVAVGGLITAGEFVVTGVPSVGLLGLSAMIGVTCSAPALLLLWWSLSSAETTLVTTLGMMEGPWTVIFIMLRTGMAPGWVAVAAGALITTAAIIEVRFGRAVTAPETSVELRE